MQLIHPQVQQFLKDWADCPSTSLVTSIYEESKARAEAAIRHLEITRRGDDDIEDGFGQVAFLLRLAASFADLLGGTRQDAA